jgi:metallo-beta-lactamase class B
MNKPQENFSLVLVVVMFLTMGLAAQAHPDWTTPFPPHHVIGNIYYVGSQGLASYLITTSQGEHSHQ